MADYQPKTIAVDLDGVLASYDRWRGTLHFGPPIAGAQEFLLRLRRLGRVLIYTTRTNPAANDESVVDLVDRVRHWLDDHQLPYDAIHCGGGKPIAAAYVDDRAVVCRPQDDGPGAYLLALECVQELIRTEK